MSAHVEIIGQGQPLVMIHGWGMHSGVWQPLIKRLSKQYMLYLVDLPGMGNSRPVEPYHLHSLADEIAQVIPGVSDVLGWSLGGLVAQRIALNQPDRIRRLILVGSTPCFVSNNEWDAVRLIKRNALRHQAAQRPAQYIGNARDYLCNFVCQ